MCKLKKVRTTECHFRIAALVASHACISIRDEVLAK